MENEEKTHRDPRYEELKFCKEDEPKVHGLIEYIVQLENAQVVAREALETINHANAKLTKDVEWLQKELEKYKEAAEGKEVEMIKGKMKDIDNKFNRFVHRGKL